MTTIIIAVGVAAVVGTLGAILGVIGTAALLQNHGILPYHPAGTEHADEIDDEEERVDALTVRNLIRAASAVANNEDAAKTLQLGEYTELCDRLMAAEDRFADWIEWAEGATATKTALTGAETAEAATDA